LKALVLAPFEQKALEALQALMPAVHESWMETRRLYDPDELAERVVREDVSILVIEADFAFAELFQNAPSLRLVGLCRQETNHADIEAATQHGVVVVNAPARNARAVAEHTTGLMLSLARQIPDANTYVKSQTWQDPVEPYIAMRGSELAAKTLGIIGLGAIGRIVAKLGRGFEMRVLAHDPYVGEAGTWRHNALFMSLEDLLRESDFVTLHVPGSRETDGLLGAEQLELLRPTAYLINTSSYSAVDEAALTNALRTRKLAGAAFDVFESYPISPANPLLKMPNVVLTPHIGGATEETVSRHSWMMVQAIQAYLQNRRPRRLVNPAVWRRRRGR
jgi:D-3-phosphoglycerate dehydrogenase